MAGPGVFHVEFGINETELTQALERKRYHEAEQLIRQHFNQTYLDEGCYQRTPLYICLSGTDKEEEGLRPRNLFLAKILVENGANLNYRVPATYFGSEYMSPGKTALELVVEFFNEITKHESLLPATDLNKAWRLWDPIRYKVIGLDRQVVIDYEDIKNQLRELVLLIIGFGGDVNMTDEFRMTLLHRTVVYSSDLSMTQTLVENNADINATDIRGNTPLAALCSAFPMGIQAFLEDRPSADPYLDSCHLEGKEHFLHYLLSLKDVQLDVPNKLGRTALFNCMAQGDMLGARALLTAGCDPTIRGQVTYGKRTRVISPLFVSLCSFRILRSHVERYMPYIHRSCQFLTHLVDAGYFTKSQITSELHEYLDEDFPDLLHLKHFGTQLIHLMFGGTSSNLRQFCVRAIFQNCFVLNLRPNPLLFLPKIIAPGFCLADTDSGEDYIAYLTHLLDSTVLETLVDCLHLPKDSLVYFEMELLRQRLLGKFRMFHWFRYYDEEIDGVFGDPYDSEDPSSDEDDSDLEYW